MTILSSISFSLTHTPVHFLFFSTFFFPFLVVCWIGLSGVHQVIVSSRQTKKVHQTSNCTCMPKRRWSCTTGVVERSRVMFPSNVHRHSTPLFSFYFFSLCENLSTGWFLGGLVFVIVYFIFIFLSYFFFSTIERETLLFSAACITLLTA